MSLNEQKSVDTFSNPGLGVVSQQHGDYLWKRIDPSPILMRMHRLIGAKSWDKEDGVWVMDPGREPIANEAFINDLMFILEGYINTNNIMGNLKNEEAHKICHILMKNVVIMIAMRGLDYQIHPAKRSVLVNQIDDMIFMSLTRSINDGQRIHDDMNFRPSQSSTGKTNQYDVPEKR